MGVLGKKLYYVVEDIEADNSSPGSSNFFHNFSNYLVRSGIWWDCSGLGEARKKCIFLKNNTIPFVVKLEIHQNLMFLNRSPASNMLRGSVPNPWGHPRSADFLTIRAQLV